MNSYAGDLTFKLGSGDQAVSVRIPNNQIIRPEIGESREGVQEYNTSIRTVNIDSLHGGNLNDLPLLGQTFLTSAYLFVEPYKNTFTIWQADPTADQNILPQVEAGSSFCTTSRSSTAIIQQTSTPSSSGTSAGKNSEKNSSNTRAVAGGVIGFAAMATIAAVAFFFLHRRWRERSRPDSAVPACFLPENNTMQYRNRSPLGRPNELGGGQGVRRELDDGGAILELEPEESRRELEANLK